MSVEDLHEVFGSRSEFYTGSRNSLSDIPITTKESRWSAVQGVSGHGTVNDWPTT